MGIDDIGCLVRKLETVCREDPQIQQALEIPFLLVKIELKGLAG